MTSVDWGVDMEPLHLRGVSDGKFASVETDDPMELPAVRAAREQGFEPAPEAPLWSFLPAVWPPAARAWIRDTRVRRMTVSGNGESPLILPWSTADYFEMEMDANRLLSECGLPARPPGRVWLLKSPPEMASLEAVLSRLVTSVKDAGLDIMANNAFVRHVLRDVDRLFRDDPLG